MSSQGDEIESKPKKKRLSHIHIGPNAKAMRRGLAFCPVCDADKISRPVGGKAAESDRISRGPKRG